ncbi:MAG: hypothetical protein CMB52_04915, partial [Euryarchaeota archaeon]|nr:hypothetical protein [Euryarchaeota archaeon]
MQQYLDQFHIGHAAGLIGESGFQNPIDAAKMGLIRNVHIDINVDAESRSLRIRDRGTTGMHHCAECEWGVLYDGHGNEIGNCNNYSNCPWSAFHSLAQIGKRETSLGSRGMGKSLAALAGEGGIILRTKIATEDGSHVSMASFFRPTAAGVGGWAWGLIEDEAWGESEEPGTEIEILELKSELIDVFAYPDKLVKEYVLPYWFPAIQQGVTMDLRVKGERTIKIGSKMTEKMFPPFDDKKSYGKIPVKMKQKKVGDVTNFNLHLAKDGVEEQLQGIAIIKGGKQVIKRITNFGRAIDGDLQ